MSSNASGLLTNPNYIRRLVEFNRMQGIGMPNDLIRRAQDGRLEPPAVENVPPPPPRPAWMGGQPQPQQIFPAPADFPPEPKPVLRSVLKRE